MSQPSPRSEASESWERVCLKLKACRTMRLKRLCGNVRTLDSSWSPQYACSSSQPAGTPRASQHPSQFLLRGSLRTLLFWHLDGYTASACPFWGPADQWFARCTARSRNKWLDIQPRSCDPVVRTTHERSAALVLLDHQSLCGFCQSLSARTQTHIHYSPRWCAAPVCVPPS